MIKVYHCRLVDGASEDAYARVTYPRQEVLAKVWHKGDEEIKPTLVAEVDTNDLWDAYMATRNIGGLWTLNNGVRCMAAGPMRSTHVGDILVHNGQAYAVAEFGFIKL